MISIKVPPLGESIVEATISRWTKQEGDTVAAGDTLAAARTLIRTAERIRELGWAIALDDGTRLVMAPEALSVGLVDDISDEDDCYQHARRVALTLASQPAVALQQFLAVFGFLYKPDVGIRPQAQHNPFSKNFMIICNCNLYTFHSFHIRIKDKILIMIIGLVLWYFERYLIIGL